MKKSHQLLLSAWYGKSKWIYLLLPLSLIFYVISFLRKFFLVNFAQHRCSVPVIIVGNISVGGTGKTPLIIELVKYLQKHGYTPGVVSRGYRGKALRYPCLLNSSSTASEVGDEPLLIFKTTQCAVSVAPDRVAAAQQLITQGCTIILSDDGLQHYQLGRAMEIAVVDGTRWFGNKQLLPVGPLRESIKRLKSVNFIVVNNAQGEKNTRDETNFFAMQIKPDAWLNLYFQKKIPLNTLPSKNPIHAVAGIGHPERFFKSLDGLSLSYYAHSFADHYAFSKNDFESFHDDIVVMTEKDAVKCQSFAKPNWYALAVSAHVGQDFWQAFKHYLDLIKADSKKG